jgi:hypothetical protein
VVKPKVPGLDGPTMGNADDLFGAPDVCNILESIAPNVSELQLFRDAEEAKDVYMYGKSFSVLFSFPPLFLCRCTST